MYECFFCFFFISSSVLDDSADTDVAVGVSHWPSHKVAKNANLDFFRTDLVLDFQNGGIVVQYSQDNLIHVLPEAEVDFLLLFQSLDQLEDKNHLSTNVCIGKQAHTLTRLHLQGCQNLHHIMS